MFLPCRPVVPSATGGMFHWVGTPQSVLINGRGFYGDCQFQPDTFAPAPCNVTAAIIPPGESPQQPQASLYNPGERMLAALTV